MMKHRSQFAGRFSAVTRPARCRGAVMSEMVLVTPLLIVVLAYLVYFGRGMVRVQHAAVMDRYEVWREVAAAVDENGVAWGPHVQANSTIQLNRTFFDGNADTIDVSYQTGFHTDAPDELLRRTELGWSTDARVLLEAIFDDLPTGRTMTFRTSHDNTIRLYEPFEGPIRHSHQRLGNDWRFVNGVRRQMDGTWRPAGPRVSHNGTVVETFFQPFDEVMSFLEDGGNAYAGLVRRLYLSQPGYAGPEVQ